MNRLAIALVAVCSALVTGCAPGTFSEHPGLSLDARVSRLDSKLFVVLNASVDTSPCPGFGSGLTGTINGRPMEVLSSGGAYWWRSEHSGVTREVCGDAILSGDLVAGDADVAIVLPRAAAS